MFTTKKLLPIAALCTVVLLTAAGVVLDGAVGRAGAQREDGEEALQNLLKLEGALPSDIEGAHSPDIARIQRSADRFSWQEFVALNWPVRADQRGEQDRNKGLSDLAPRVWETWKETHEVFLPEGATPPEWNAPQEAPAGLQGKIPRSLSIHLLTGTLQATQAEDIHPATLTDQHGHLIRYETRMNQVMFDHIRQNHLYDSRKQGTKDSIEFPFGSMIIKASWRELEPKEENRFLTADAWVADLKEGKSGKWRRKRMGLVGLHIVQKTPNAPEWVWSTFEHVDNLTGPHPSFHNPSRANLPTNQQTRPGTPNQVTRVSLPVEEAGGPDHARDLRELNRAMQKALAEAHSVLQYYELVDTQWPLQDDWKASYTPKYTIRPQPIYVSNTTMETFTQESSTCMGCHSTARTARPDRTVSADFTFLLSNAQPVLKDPARILPPEKPVTDWDKQNWRAILRGRELLQHTYELLPQYTTAKYHCESCHLDGAGNSDAPWWVGMLAKYDFPATDKLQARINRCFKRSMNGTPIPSAHGEDEIARKAPEMHAFITYMKWMDEQYARRTSAPPKTGLPAMPKVVGFAERGKAIFLQKCATCHGKDGQGRYGSNAYYRPALWGPHACNKGASMDDFPKLVPFLKQNMPYKSGGLLTDREAWDVATYIISQTHPDFQNDEGGAP